MAVRRGSSHGRGDAPVDDPGRRAVRRGPSEPEWRAASVGCPLEDGFKHAKAIVRIRFVEQQPLNTWRKQAPQDYGFYANVNPTVDHPRWSQATERRLPGFLRNHKTLMFKGYGDQVESLYSGMDLRKNF